MNRVNTLTIFLLLIFAGLIQASGLDYIALLGVKPDLLLAIVVFFCLSCSKIEAVKTAIAAGLIKDITSSSILGGYTLSFFLTALFLTYHQRKFYKEKSFTQIFVTFFGYFFVSFSVLLLQSIANRASIPHYPFLNIAFKGAVYTGLIAPPLFFGLSKALRVPLAPGV